MIIRAGVEVAGYRNELVLVLLLALRDGGSARNELGGVEFRIVSGVGGKTPDILVFGRLGEGIARPVDASALDGPAPVIPLGLALMNGDGARERDRDEGRVPLE